MDPVALPELAADPEPRFVEYGGTAPGGTTYRPLPALVYEDGKVMTEWKLTEAERDAILRGENIRLWIWGRLPPLQLEVTSEDRG